MEFMFTNTKDHYVYPMGRALAPGESVLLNSQDCPELAPNGGDEQATPADPDAELDALIKKLRRDNSDDIIAQLPAMESSLIEKLGEAEQQDKQPRKKLLGAIAEEQMRRAEEERLAAEARAKAEADAAAAAAGLTT